MKKIIFFGSGYFIIPVIDVLRDQGLELVITNEPNGKLIDYLKKENIPYVFSQLKDSETIQKVKDIKPDLGILASFGAFVPDSIVETFPLGILNIHPSLLPKFKGPSPIQFTILEGITDTGVSVIQLDDELDHGPIVLQIPVKIMGNETAPELLESMFQVGAEMINKIVQDVNKGLVIKSNPQNHKMESWSLRIEKQDGKIDLDSPLSLVDVSRKIRAFYPWPGVHLTVSLGGKNKILKLMPYDMVQVEGKNPMSYKDFVNGYGEDAINILKKLNLYAS